MTIFGNVFQYYHEYRPPYPKELFRRILAALSASRELAVDLGAGTGLSTIPLLSFFKRVIAVDCDTRMTNALPKGIEVLLCRAEEINGKVSDANLITSGNAFYWMETDTVLQMICAALEPGGVFAAYRYSFPRFHGNTERIIRRELTQHWDRFRHPHLVDKEYTFRSIRESSQFSHVQREVIENAFVVTVDQIIGFFRSTSYGSAYLATLEAADIYLSKLRAELLDSDPGNGRLMELPVELVLAISPPIHRSK